MTRVHSRFRGGSVLNHGWIMAEEECPGAVGVVETQEPGRDLPLLVVKV
jgi:hypothetical protein